MLLDSNVLIFWTSRSSMLSPSVQNALRLAPRIVISMAAVLELEIKRGAGKLNASLDWKDLTNNLVDLLPIEVEDAVVAGSLPLHHRDPFDRMIIAQAMRRGLPIATSDRVFEQYGVPVVWA
jgi:PIN domain nuclease of toxin-antitoxin system